MAPTAPISTDQASQRVILSFQLVKINMVIPAWTPKNTWNTLSIDPVTKFII